MSMDTAADRLLKRYHKARERRSVWEAHWRECYEYVLPQRQDFLRHGSAGDKGGDRLFDGTAADAVDQLAASLMAHLTPPWARWFGLAPGRGIGPEDREAVAPALERAAETIQSHLDRSNLAVEMHQCYLDLVTCGTASLMFEEAPLGETSAFRFTAVPLADLVVEEGTTGKLDVTFRRSLLTVAALRERFPEAVLSDELLRRAKDDPDLRLALIEAVIPEGHGHAYTALLNGEEAADTWDSAPGKEAVVLAEGRFAASPFINFRWLKAPGEAYGRSPVMKALPDIKTANKVVELVLKNATIAVTGIWQADDDGVLNPANIKLIPGTIIPKAVGSAGLTPLEAPGRFDISQLVLTDLRARIRHALLVDQLGQIASPRMTATEILERAAEMARILGATYGRLQSELLTPLILRAVAILRRRGEIPPLRVDGHLVNIQYRAPLAQAQAHQDAQSTLSWLEAVGAMGPEAAATVDMAAAARWLGRTFGVPGALIRERTPDTIPGSPLQ
ncbi:MAG: head-tail connector protein [Alphaproteobacteria bacterium]|nr:head-tail connector protein [Alphaproteobacteria bacterium]